MSSAIITDSPEKKKIKEKESKKRKNTEITREKLEKEKHNNNCMVCNKRYTKSKQDWFRCKVCSGWAHKICRIKEALHFFCKNCF